MVDYSVLLAAGVTGRTILKASDHNQPIVVTPFGGFGKSGIGREKGLEALDSYLQTKNVAIALEPDTSEN